MQNNKKTGNQLNEWITMDNNATDEREHCIKCKQNEMNSRRMIK